MSFMTAEEYYNYLFQQQSQNPPTIALLAAAENPYKIDVLTRKVEAPEFLSVARDHRSETIYFVIDRYVDYMDLAETCCIVQYTNLTTKKSYIYHVPFYDLTSFSTPSAQKIVFPWCIDGAATEVAGTVEYAFSFYKVDTAAKKFLYNLNTLPVTGKVLHGLNVQPDPAQPALMSIEARDHDGGVEHNAYVSITPTLYEDLQAQIDVLKKAYEMYWEEE